MPRNRPDGWPTLAPRIVTPDVVGLVDFLAAVFGAQGELRGGGPTEMRIGDSIVMVSNGGGLRDAMPAFLYVYVDDVDETFARALAAGARSIEDPADMPYGDRRATVSDSWGNLWQVATRLPA
jgi:uncharacterized glyoxalase superfamily protein PhnB